MYDGRTQVGAPAQTRDVGRVTITKLAVGDLDNNAYLLVTQDGKSLLIDAAAEPERLLALLPNGHLDAVLTTHHHADHWGALSEVVAATSAVTIAGAQEARDISVPTDRPVSHGDTVTLGDITLEIIGLRGHTPDSIAVRLRGDDGSEHIFTGDSLFPGGVGRTTPETFPQLLSDVTQRLFDRFPQAWIYPGHGWDTTLETERPHLAQWQARGW